MPANYPGKLVLTYCKMLRSGLVLLCILLLVANSGHAGSSRFVATDSEGNKISLSAPARRIISLSPHATELLFAVGAGEYVVAAAEYSDYPKEARKIQRIGSHGRVDMEILLSLNPDLVVAWTSGNSAGDIAAIQQLGIPLFFSDPKRLEDIPHNLENLARLTDTEKTAVREIKKFVARHAVLAKRKRNKEQVNVFYQLWHRPLMTVSSNHLISDVIELCGGVNVFASSPSLTPVVGIENIISANPQVIVASNIGQAELSVMWQKWPGIAAVENKSMITIPADLLNRQGPRIIQAAEMMCNGLASTRP